LTFAEHLLDATLRSGAVGAEAAATPLVATAINTTTTATLCNRRLLYILISLSLVGDEQLLNSSL
jgi:hypothetical protein